MKTNLSNEKHFGSHKYYGKNTKTPKPKFGCLKYLHTENNVEVLIENMSFNHLQMKKLDYVAKGWDPKKLKITY